MNETDGPKKLIRTRTNRMLAGVCSGLGSYFGIDPNLVRLVLAILTLFGGTGIILYLAGWLLIPEEGESTSIAEGLINQSRRQ